MSAQFTAKFIGGLIWECLPPPDSDKMRVLGRFHFRDSKGRIWTVERDTITDGTSVGFLLELPLVGWLTRLVLGGDQFTGTFRRASALHDGAYRRGDDRAEADRMHYEAALCDGAELWRADAVYTLLRWFGWKAYADNARLREEATAQ